MSFLPSDYGWLVWNLNCRRQFPWFPAGAFQEFVGSLIVGKYFTDGIPSKFFAAPAGNVAKVADSGGTMAGFYIGPGHGSCFDAFEPILDMVFAETFWPVGYGILQ